MLLLHADKNTDKT